MKFKEIKPWMRVECKNRNEKYLLLQEAERLGYLWPDGRKPTEGLTQAFLIKMGRTVNFYPAGYRLGKKYITHYESEGNVQCSDLLIGEEHGELSAKEAFKICKEICDHYSNSERDCENCNKECPFKQYPGMDCASFRLNNPNKVENICLDWKKKKEEELQKKAKIDLVWADVCRIIEINQKGQKKVVYEEELDVPFKGSEEIAAEAVFRKFLIEHEGNFIMVLEHVCRPAKESEKIKPQVDLSADPKLFGRINRDPAENNVPEGCGAYDHKTGGCKDTGEACNMCFTRENREQTMTDILADFLFGK